MQDMKPYKIKENRVLSSLSTNIQQPASLVDVQTMLLKKKKKNHISSLQNHQISIFVSPDPHYSLPEIFENKYCLTTNEKAKRQKRRRRNKTYLPSSSQNRNSHGECDANCRKHKGGHVEESLRPFSPKQNKPHVFFFFCSNRRIPNTPFPFFHTSSSTSLTTSCHAPQLLFLPQRRGKLSNPMQQSSSSSLVKPNVPMKFPK